MPAARTLPFARLSRCAIVGSGTRNARAISSVVSPPTSRRVSATCDSSESAGWQQAKISERRSSGSGSSMSGSARCGLESREELRLSRERLVAPDQVDRPVSRRRDDPGAGVRRRSVPRPALDRCREGVLNRLLGEVEVAEDPGEDRDRAAELLAEGGGDRVYAAASPGPKLRGTRPRPPRRS